MEFTVILELSDEGGFVVKCLELPVTTQGETKEDALMNIKEAIGAYLEVEAQLDRNNKVEKTKTIEVRDVTEEKIIKELPEVPMSGEEKKNIELSIQDMKKGDYVTLEELGAEFEKEKAAKLYMEGKISLSGAAENAKLTIPEMVDYLVSKGFKSEYSMDDFREGVALLEKKLKQRKTDS